ncbi:hypothetical protein L198_05881 [Cryptococcus wingfieldii CBS 7118]|uniref:Uncharacterized protein n=1 Tax=Cryptococcus wingfieldii CBS 7118 TaxID=1295528 RepID=A0A1E3IS12_9TREE|nr:hypothetical protein L198_05881 [Cryptococcus wingfieldii CBS 7118]ODN91369.1 hypothetical protein L198_05881 [Cryptococcus wingfieldii CBS 7118]
MATPQHQPHVSEEAIELSDLRKSSSAIPLVPIVSYHCTNDHKDIEPIAQYVLPPVDGGKKESIFLVAATMIAVLVWGILFAVGVLLAFWTSTLFPNQSSSTLTLVAKLQTGLLYMNSAVIGPFLTAVPRWQRTFQVMGILAASVALMASAFSSKPWHILVTIGLLYPLAVRLSHASNLSEEQRKALESVPSRSRGSASTPSRSAQSQSNQSMFQPSFSNQQSEADTMFSSFSRMDSGDLEERAPKEK